MPNTRISASAGLGSVGLWIWSVSIEIDPIL